ncbi:MAG: phosphatidylserine decarboxylase [Candidatus Altiarchaeota archaeon]|nr:phosphatidylserine decarboxylase [Candidatus Altiarchaeota archaeon]
MVLFNESRHLLLFEAVSFAVLYIVFPIASILCIFALLFTVYFFRDPERKVPGGDVIVAPADGIILEVSEIDDSFVGRGWLVATFMGPFDVHVNRAPVAGEIESIAHTPGKKVAAYLAGDLNARERNRIEIKGRGCFVLTQYAGVFARRIVSFKKINDKIDMGERIGMIKFGSRADVVFPKKYTPSVARGQKVVAGETILGVLDAKA